MMVGFKMSLGFWLLCSPIAIMFLAVIVETIIEKITNQKTRNCNYGKFK